MGSIPRAYFGILLLLLFPGGQPANPLRELVEQAPFPDFHEEIGQFYESGGWQRAWIHDTRITARAWEMAQILGDADSKGLEPADYGGPLWRQLLTRLSSGATADELDRADLALTAAAMRYVSDLHVGRSNPGLYHFQFDLARGTYDLDVLLRQIIDSKDLSASIQQVEPPFDGYRRTLEALARYRVLSRAESGEVLTADAPAVARRLRILGDYPTDAPDPAGSAYSGALVDAVKRFQSRHGLDADGRIGKATVAQLNMPLSYRERQLALTLERWRWVPHIFSRPPIVVNLPEFRLRALNASYNTELEMKVVVGRAYRHKTPVFSAELKQVIFHPYWNVPLSIQRAELVPQIEKDRSYLAKHDYEVVTKSGGVVLSGSDVPDEILKQLRSGALEIRQAPGPKNALGLVKFVFPNANNVYLHDTPSVELFARSRRDFSHGCIRVEKPGELAQWVLREDPSWPMERITAAMNGPQPLQVNLKQPIPVLIVYGTAVALEGEVRFLEDIYGWDAALEAQLKEQSRRRTPVLSPTSAVPGPRPRG